jgi:hypothetical protein
MDQILGKTTASQGFAADLVLAFAGLSLLLAAVGLYGVLSYLVTQRVSESESASPWARSANRSCV